MNVRGKKQETIKTNNNNSYISKLIDHSTKQYIITAKITIKFALYKDIIKKNYPKVRMELEKHQIHLNNTSPTPSQPICTYTKIKERNFWYLLSNRWRSATNNSIPETEREKSFRREIHQAMTIMRG